MIALLIVNLILVALAILAGAFFIGVKLMPAITALESLQNAVALLGDAVAANTDQLNNVLPGKITALYQKGVTDGIAQDDAASAQQIADLQGEVAARDAGITAAAQAVTDLAKTVGNQAPIPATMIDSQIQHGDPLSPAGNADS